MVFNSAMATVCGIYESYLYPDGAEPRFVLAFSVNAGISLLAIGAAMVLHFVLRENGRLEESEREAEAAGNVAAVGRGYYRYVI